MDDLEPGPQVRRPRRRSQITVAVESIPLVRAAFESLVETVPGVQLATAGTGDRADVPMVVIEVDVGQGRPHRQGGTLTPPPQAGVLRLAPSWEPTEAMGALQDGVLGCLTTGASLADLAAAIRRVARGEVALSRDLTRALGPRPELQGCSSIPA